MKIAVLGGGGFIGRATCARLAAGGHEVVALLRRPAPGLAVACQVADFSDPLQFREALEGCDWLVHAAAGSTPGSTLGQPRAEIAANLAVSLALVEALQSVAGCGVLYLSSGGTVYGDCGDAPVREAQPLRPRSYHGAAKAAVELFLSAYASQYGGAVVVLRPSNVYGPGQGQRGGFGIVPTAMAAALSGEPVTLWGDGSTVRDYLYIDDLVDLIETVVRAGAFPGFSVFNAASGQAVSLVDLLDTVATVCGRSMHRVFQPGRRVDVATIAPSSAAAFESHGWQARTSLEQGLRRTWSWFQEPGPL
ncbi:MAG: NAD-dependent epimerase/dehydratase family protein [Xanthomonadales bacterium]|nr:NAD-dependent epimerase/dehydratase family protein [Xanthomonadales bacterium]